MVIGLFLSLDLHRRMPFPRKFDCVSLSTVLRVILKLISSRKLLLDFLTSSPAWDAIQLLIIFMNITCVFYSINCHHLTILSFLLLYFILVYIFLSFIVKKVIILCMILLCIHVLCKALYKSVNYYYYYIIGAVKMSAASCFPQCEDWPLRYRDILRDLIRWF